MITDIKLKGIKEALETLNPKKVERAAFSALNETIKSTRAKASDIVRKEQGWKLKKSDFDRRISMKLARQGDLTAILSAHRISAATGRRTGKDSFALTYFGAKEVRRTNAGVTIKTRKGVKTQKRSRAAQGVNVQVKRAGKIANYPHAFIASMKSGHIGVFRRSGKKIREVKVITVATMFRGTFPKLRAHVQQKFKERFDSKLKLQERG